jgi:hypothetical protein
MTIEETLKERGEQYGEFADHAKISQTIKRLAAGKELPDVQREALEMIAHKLARIINGNANHIDSWLDIAGYATLVVEKLKQKTIVVENCTFKGTGLTPEELRQEAITRSPHEPFCNLFGLGTGCTSRWLQKWL